MIAATAALEWVWRNWKLIATGLGFAILGIMLLVAKGDARSWHRRYDQVQALYQREQLAHSVTRASLATSLAAIDDQNRAVQALAAESASRTKASEQARIAAQDAARASLGVARALDASAAVARPDGPCTPSDAFLKSRGEL